MSFSEQNVSPGDYGWKRQRIDLETIVAEVLEGLSGESTIAVRSQIALD
jgi:hypothetical protein